MHENALMRYSKAVGDATESAAQAELSPTLMVSCLTRYIDVVVHCADDSDFRPNWSTGGAESTDKHAQCASLINTTKNAPAESVGSTD